METHLADAEPSKGTPVGKGLYRQTRAKNFMCICGLEAE